MIIKRKHPGCDFDIEKQREEYLRVKIRVNQLIPSQEKSGTLNGVSVRVVVLKFTSRLH